MPYVEYLVSITFLGKPEPDDPRELGEQAEEQMDALGYWLADLGAHLEVLKRFGDGATPTGHDNGD